MKFLLMLAALCLTFAAGVNPARAASLDVGLGLGFANSNDSNGFEGGWDLMAGYEGGGTQDWYTGGQLHLLKGWTDKSKFNNYPSDTTMYFESAALYATARPRDEWLDWLQLKAGVVSASFKTIAMEGEGAGLAVGAGIVFGGDTFRLHLLDVHEYLVAGHRFTIVSINIAILGDLK